MKKLKYIIAITAMVVATSCDNDKYLETENLYGKSLETYYSTPTDIEEAIDNSLIFSSGLRRS